MLFKLISFCGTHALWRPSVRASLPLSVSLRIPHLSGRVPISRNVVCKESKVEKKEEAMNYEEVWNHKGGGREEKEAFMRSLLHSLFSLQCQSSIICRLMMDTHEWGAAAGRRVQTWVWGDRGVFNESGFMRGLAGSGGVACPSMSSVDLEQNFQVHYWTFGPFTVYVFLVSIWSGAAQTQISFSLCISHTDQNWELQVGGWWGLF